MENRGALQRRPKSIKIHILEAGYCEDTSHSEKTVEKEAQHTHTKKKHDGCAHPNRAVQTDWLAGWRSASQRPVCPRVRDLPHTRDLYRLLWCDEIRSPLDLLILDILFERIRSPRSHRGKELGKGFLSPCGTSSVEHFAFRPFFSCNSDFQLCNNEQRQPQRCSLYSFDIQPCFSPALSALDPQPCSSAVLEAHAAWSTSAFCNRPQ